jgi:hypothetical protein
MKWLDLLPTTRLALGQVPIFKLIEQKTGGFMTIWSLKPSSIEVRPQSDHGQYAFNTEVNATSHHSHPRSIHSQSMVNPWSIHSQRHNNGATTP